MRLCPNVWWGGGQSEGIFKHRNMIEYVTNIIYFVLLLFAGNFDSIVKCEDNHLQLHCTENKILAINSAMFGRSRHGTIECPSYTMHEVGKSFISLSVCLSLYVCPSVRPDFCMSTWLFVCSTVCLLVCLILCMSVCLSWCPSYLSIRSSVCLSVCLLVCSCLDMCWFCYKNYIIFLNIFNVFAFTKNVYICVVQSKIEKFLNWKSCVSC